MFNRIIVICSLFSFFICVWGVSTALCGPSPFVVFAENREFILSKRSCQLEGYTFAVGVAKAIKLTPSSLDRARQKARLKAQANLISPISQEQDDWPSHIRDGIVGQQIRVFLEENTHSSVVVKGLQSVYDNCREQECLNVVVVPSDQLEVPEPKRWKEIIKDFDNQYLNGVLHLPMSGYFEIATAQNLDRALVDYAKNIGSTYGKSAGLVIVGEPVDEIPLLWRKGKRLSADKVKQLDQDGLWQLLSLDPYDPVVLFYLAKIIEGQGRLRLASVLYARGTVWFIEPEYNNLCFEAVRRDLLPAGLERLPLPDVGLRQKVLDAFKAAMKLPPGVVELVVRSNGSMPLAERFSSNTLPELDGDNVAAVIEAEVSSRSFAMLAKGYLGRGEWLIAMPFARQATRMNNQFTPLQIQAESQQRQN